MEKKKKTFPPAGIELMTPCTAARRSNHSAIEAVDGGKAHHRTIYFHKSSWVVSGEEVLPYLIQKPYSWDLQKYRFPDWTSKLRLANEPASCVCLSTFQPRLFRPGLSKFPKPSRSSNNNLLFPAKLESTLSFAMVSNCL